jgi:hypothetical protein
MKRLLLVLLGVLAFPVMASHIVGGEFELIHVTGNVYRLNLIIYFDKINGNPGAKDDGANSPRASIFRKRDGQLMTQVVLTLTQESPVAYTQPECSNEGLETDRLYYTALVTLPADTYNDPEGYYISWQRCCRNYNISNIFSDDPNGTNPQISAGQTFYLEFPPVVKNGEPFINSSPRLFPPLSDYGCPNRLYYVDFAGVDDDGDSLVYSLTTPLNTTATLALPPAAPAPYPEITWRPGFNLSRIMRGAPDLKISKDGLLTVTPTLLGLYVFAVKVEEYRNRIKIGESRRDFQMLVVDGCPNSSPPEIVGRRLSDATYSDSDNIALNFPASTPDSQRKMIVRVTDPDAGRAEDNFIEKIRIRIVPLNFKNDEVKGLLPTVTSATLLGANSAKEFEISFPKCPFFKGGPYQIGIIAQDDACSLPLLDTLKVSVNVEPPPNERVRFVTPTPTEVRDIINEGDRTSYPFEAIDAETDDLSFFALTNGFDLAGAGMTTVIESNENGRIKGRLEWDARCDLFNFASRTSFQVKLLVDDSDLCDFNDPDTAQFDLSVILPGNADPIVDTDLTTDPQETVVTNLERKVNSNWSFNVTANDAIDNDKIALRLVGKDFKPSDYGMTFAKQFGTGPLNSTFTWNLRCDKIDPAKKELFHLQFLAVDSTNKCRLRKADTVNVYVKVLPPDHAAPRLHIASLNERVPYTNNRLTAYLGETVNLQLTGTDEDLLPQPDPLRITLFAIRGDSQPEGYQFETATGTTGLQTTFRWAPGCDLFKPGVYEYNYTFTFRISDLNCGRTKADTVAVDITWKDYEGGVLLADPPNVFTPNGDGFNDYYAMEKIDAASGERINLIPPDNCTGSFVMIQVFNRWGKEVFASTDRNFKWFAKNEPAGVYYYLLKFTDREYKGNISVQY